jgi:hypothetical protein
MFELLKRWYGEWDERYKRQEERAGYDWAKSLMEQGHINSVERFVESAADFGTRNAFDRGVLRALQTWRSVNEAPTAVAPVDVDLTKDIIESIPMILHCPMCYIQHIDDADFRLHTSHLCTRCGFIWRPADVPTVGVTELKTHGEDDGDPNDWFPALRSEAEGFLAEAIYQYYNKVGLSDIGVFKFAERVVLWARDKPEERLPALRKLGAALESAAPNRCARFRHRDTGKTFVYMTLAKYPADEKKSVVIYRSEGSGQVWAMSHDDFYDGRFEHLMPDA